MKIVISQRPDGGMSASPVIKEMSEQEIESYIINSKLWYKDFPRFITETLPPKKDPQTKECFRCSWFADMVNKKVVVNKPCTCIHNDLLKLDKILDNPSSTRQQKLDAMLDKELLIRKQKVK